jgi:hypothetical protein
MNNWIDKINYFKSFIPNPPSSLNKKGIVLSSGDKHFVSAYMIVKQLDRLGCSLEIEWYYQGDELFDFQKEEIKKLNNVKLIDVNDLKMKWFEDNIGEIGNLKGYIMKPFILLNSTFDEILFIDSDNFPLIDPSYLFECDDYKNNKNIFWADIDLEDENMKKKLLPGGYEIFDEMGITRPEKLNESGQFLINRNIFWKEVALSFYLNYNKHFFYKYFFGDKDLYYVAFKLNNSNYYQNKYLPYSFGIDKFQKINGLVQRCPISGDPLFLHRTLSKININNYNFIKYFYPIDEKALTNQNTKNNWNIWLNQPVDSNLTLVTCFYDLNRENWEYNSRDNNYYHEWFKNILAFNNLNLVLFTDKKSYSKVKNLIDNEKSNSRIMINIYELPENKDIKKILDSKKFKELVKNRNKQDIECYNSDYTSLMHKKIEFIEKAIKDNYFNTKYYGWIDYGYIRKEPSENYFLPSYTNRVVFSQLQNIEKNNLETCIKDGKEYISGGFFYGVKDEILHMTDLYKNFLNKFMKQNLVSSDQMIFHQIYLSSDVIQLKNLEDKWFGLLNEQNILSCNRWNPNENMKELDEENKKILINLKPLYQKNLKSILEYYKKELTLDIINNGYLMNINNINRFLSNLLELKNYVNKSTFWYNCYLLYLGKTKNKNAIISLLLDLRVNNLINQETILIISNYSILLNDKEIINVIKIIPEEYLLFYLTRINSFGFIEINNVIQILNRSKLKFNKLMSEALNTNNNNPEKILDEILELDLEKLEIPFYISGFYFWSFQNRNNKNLRQKISKLHRKLFPLLNQDNKKREITRKKRRIAFISNNLFLHSVGRDRIGIIKNLNRDLFDVTILHFIDRENDVYFNDLKNSGWNNIVLEGSYVEWVKKIDKLDFDIIVYPDIGMNFQTYLLAHCRLAPIQITTWGHSETSGIDTIDYYISSKLYEKDSEDHYSEKLIKQESLCTFYYDKWYDIILNQKDNLYKFNPKIKYITYLQFLHKISNDDINLFNDILSKHNDIKIIMINGSSSEYDKNIVSKKMSELGHKDKIVILPKQKTGNLYDLIVNSYLIIDSYPHGGCNTSLECFYFGKVVITRPSDYLRGRFTCGFYQKMGITGTLTNNLNEQSKLISLYINKPELKNYKEKEILKKSHLLFNDLESIFEWNKLLNQIGK